MLKDNTLFVLSKEEPPCRAVSQTLSFIVIHFPFMTFTVPREGILPVTLTGFLFLTSRLYLP